MEPYEFSWIRVKIEVRFNESTWFFLLSSGFVIPLVIDVVPQNILDSKISIPIGDSFFYEDHVRPRLDFSNTSAVIEKNIQVQMTSC